MLQRRRKTITKTRTALTKKDIAEMVYEELGYDPGHSHQECFNMIETLIEIIKSTLETGEEVLISGFGKFDVKEKTERRGRNPATGEDMVLKARRVVTFNASKTLRDLVNDC